MAPHLVVLSLLVAIPASPAAVGAQADPGPSLAAALVGGVLGGALGTVAGVYLSSDDYCSGLCRDGFSGPLVGEVVGVAVGAHLFNQAQGHLLTDLAVSAAIVAAGLGLGEATDENLLAAAMIGQVVGVAIAETRASPTVRPTTAVRRTPEGLAVELGFRVR